MPRAFPLGGVFSFLAAIRRARSAETKFEAIRPSTIVFFRPRFDVQNEKKMRIMGGFEGLDMKIDMVG